MESVLISTKTCPSGRDSCQMSRRPSLTRWSTETNTVRFSFRVSPYRSSRAMGPAPRREILSHTASTSLSSSSSWALFSNLSLGCLALSSARMRSLSRAISISSRASSKASMSSYMVTGRIGSLLYASLNCTSGTTSWSSS